jgi:hypothetical protein
MHIMQIFQLEQKTNSEPKDQKSKLEENPQITWRDIQGLTWMFEDT